jgi:hypothetical protein
MTETEDRNEWYRIGGRCDVAAYVLGNASGEVKLLYLHLQHDDDEIGELTHAGFTKQVGILGLCGTQIEAVCSPGSRTAIQHAKTQFMLEVLLNRLDYLRETETQELTRLFALPDSRTDSQPN